MDEKKHEEEGEVKVADHRRFDSEGKPKAQSEEEREGQQGADEGTQSAGPEPAAGEGSEKEKSQGIPPIDFPTFVLSLATSGQVHLGVLPNPATGKQECNLALAKETIDLLAILRDKTKGNLTEDEERLFDYVLYDLRMQYVEKNKK